jgi:hypothetical protein
MAILYTDVALNQQQNLNFPGFPGSLTLTTQPGRQNNASIEGPNEIKGTYTWVGTEAVGDIINIGILPAGAVVRAPEGSVQSGTTAPAVTLTVAVGDNDLALLSAQPIPNSMVPVDTQVAPNQAPLWVAATSYVKGNVVYDPASTPANQVFTCIASVSGSTAPSSDSTNWIANQKRYSGSINIAGASGDVEFAAGTQFYGGPASLLPYSTVPGQAALGLTANQIANSQYQIQQDCWAQAVILTISTPVAGTVSVFRIPYEAAN